MPLSVDTVEAARYFPVGAAASAGMVEGQRATAAVGEEEEHGATEVS
jgi:hypothetical protein